MSTLFIVISKKLKTFTTCNNYKTKSTSGDKLLMYGLFVWKNLYDINFNVFNITQYQHY